MLHSPHAHERRSQEVADALRRLLVGLNTGAIALLLGASAKFLDSGYPPGWAIWSFALFMLAFGAIVASLVAAKGRELARRDAAARMGLKEGESASEPKVPVWRASRTWDLLGYGVFVLGVLTAVLSLPTPLFTEAAADSRAVVDWLSDFSKTLIATFVGAGLAFLAAIKQRELESRRNDRLAGTAASQTLTEYVNDFLNFRRAFVEGLEDQHARMAHGTHWLVARPVSHAFSRHADFDWKGLAYLVDDDPGTLNKLGIVRRRLSDLESLAQLYNEAAAEKQQAMAKTLSAPVQDIRIAEQERQVGFEIIGRLQTAIEAILLRLSDDDGDYDGAISALKDSLTRLFPDERVVKCKPISDEWRDASRAKALLDAKYQPRFYNISSQPVKVATFTYEYVNWSPS